MSRLPKKHARTIIVLAVTVAVLIGTALVIGLPEPESHVVKSVDGQVQVEGTWADGGQAPRVVKQTVTTPFVALQGAAYQISGSVAPVGSPYLLTFAAPADVVGSAVLYRYNPDLDAWQIYPSTPAADGWSLTTQVQSLPTTLWGVGAVMAVQRPAFSATMLDELLGDAPPNAVGYEGSDALVNASGDAVVLSDPLDTGGCDGIFMLGSSQTKTSRQIPFETGTYRVTVTWQLGNGCTAGTTMTSAREGK